MPLRKDIIGKIENNISPIKRNGGAKIAIGFGQKQGNERETTIGPIGMKFYERTKLAVGKNFLNEKSENSIFVITTA